MVVLGFVVGTLNGWIVNYIHGRDFLRGSLDDGHDVDRMKGVASTPWLDRIWLIMMFPGLVLAALVAFQVDVDALFASDYLDKPASLLGALSGALAVTMRLGRHDMAFVAIPPFRQAKQSSGAPLPTIIF